MTTQMSSRQFNREHQRRKKAAENGPVYITDQGRPAHVLLTFDDYEELVGPHRALDLLASRQESRTSSSWRRRTATWRAGTFE